MRSEQVAAFFEYVQKHQPIADRLRAETGNEDVFCRLAAELGLKAGFEFDPADVREALHALLQKPPQLTDAELAGVAGGLCQNGTIVPRVGGGGCAGSQTDALLSNPVHLIRTICT
jgi:hypothetical protein